MHLPKLDDDLFIEPPNDEDVIYGDYNDTMDGEPSVNRPYLRLTTSLRNITRNSGTDVRLRCDAIGTAPIAFEWKKNHAPVEKSRRLRIRHRENTSRLVISSLDVLDSAFYECIATNPAGSVNSTAILKVKNAPHSEKVRNRPSTSRVDHNEEDYDEYEEMDDPRGRLPSEEDSDLYSVPDNAAGPGFIPSGPSERWLDEMKIKEGQCVLYRGEACRSFLAGRHIRITTKNREDMYDVDRNLRAAIMFINNFDRVKPECKRISHAVACFHMYKVCDPSDHTKTQSICKEDCNKMTEEMCPSEMAEASSHDLIGDSPRALFPICSALPPDPNCIPILKTPTPSRDPIHSKPRPDHWCYTESGMNYQGMVSLTQTGKECIDWSASSTREFSTHTYPQLRQSANYCRNPGGRRPRPWCYSSSLGQEEYCDIPMCPPDLVNQFGGGNNGNAIGNSSSLPALWVGLGPSLQLAVLGGFGALCLLLIILLCVFCRRRGGEGGVKGGVNSASSHPPPSLPTIHSAPHSTINTAYYRKMNGTSTPMTTRGVEMASLLSGGTRIPMNPVDGGLYDESMSEPFHVLDIQQNALVGMRQIGHCNLGVMLSMGTWSGSPNGEMPIVAKISSRDIASRAIVEDEINRVAALSHPNLLCLLGVTYLDGESLAAIYEYSVNGSLLALCRLRAVSEERERETHLHDFLSCAIQISAGLEYLSLQGLIHKDVSARNVLVGEGMHVKLADIAAMINDYNDDYVNMGARTLLPIRWMSREAIEGGRFTPKSDVWAFGVTLWEMYSYGRQPYEGYPNHQITHLLTTRQLLEPPAQCPTNMYSVMVECWHDSPDRRPSFSELHRRLQTWGSMSPAPRGTSSSSHSGSSARGGTMAGRSRAPPPIYPQRGLRRPEDASPLMGMIPTAYEYTDEDGDSD
ncbi:hypothetical protein PFISCL1PPCAC_6159 [Pristionchus fissidentatus]|uniref:receptor protein-tyrosine kinase n=1 Tax=Pristionchus fissidentatus TaxID=1538716 RepID=A0AAV5V9F3_9BILA|nr:hypothetical protein PFISCL1PPCAC_6159 [Pristionchus fissidentatus]